MLIGLSLKILAEIRVSNRDERLSTLGDRFSFQVDHAVFGDDIHNGGAWRRDDVAWRQVEHDSAAALAMLAIGG